MTMTNPTFQESLEKLDRAIERTRNLNCIENEFNVLMIKAMGAQLRADVSELKSIMTQMEELHRELIASKN